MILRVTTPPAEEPVSLSEIKAHLKVDVDAEDALIGIYLSAARQQCELESRRAFVTQTLQLKLEEWPWADRIALPFVDRFERPQPDRIALPRPPLQSVVSIVYTDSDGVNHTMSTDDYLVDTACEPGRVILAYGKGWPGATLQNGPSITITYIAGYGDAEDVPATYKQAVMLATGHFYENREQIVVQSGVSSTTLPWGVTALLMTDRGNF